MNRHKVEKETRKHIDEVRIFLDEICQEFKERGISHDQSKLHTPEVEVFEVYTEKLKSTTYGSEKYKQYLKEMKPAFEHHYANNRHHPEHFLLTVADDFEYFERGKKNLIQCMTLIDIVEMLCDWRAATKRHIDGDVMKSIELNQKRFGYGNELKQILINTINQSPEGK